MNIRTAKKSDIASWSAMRTVLWPDTDDNHLSELEAYFAGKSTDIAEAFLAESDGKPIGFLELNLRNYAEGSVNAKVPYIEGWYITSMHQGKGYGGQLIRHAEDWAISQGFTELASDTELHNEHSIAMHKHLGFEEIERVVCFLKQLNNP